MARPIICSVRRSSTGMMGSLALSPREPCMLGLINGESRGDLRPAGPGTRSTMKSFFLAASPLETQVDMAPPPFQGRRPSASGVLKGGEGRFGIRGSMLTDAPLTGFLEMQMLPRHLKLRLMSGGLVVFSRMVGRVTKLSSPPFKSPQAEGRLPGNGGR
jgi:hypothetical protein